ncbi:hypothetical protein FACS189413_11850 [Bacteroidia bacterium]|nr:hypothetical protein FACS189413_11850 [Bacteroidia bacterium]
MTPIQADGLWGYENPKGECEIKPQFEEASDFCEGLAAVRIGSKWGFINPKGKFVINPQFERARDFCEGLAPVEIDNRWGLIDKTGSFVINPQFGGIYPWNNEVYLIQADDSRAGLMDKKGNILVSPQFDEFHNCCGDSNILIVEFKNKNLSGFMDIKGNVIIPQFKKVKCFSEGLAGVFIGDYETGKWGFIDNAGNIVINPQFDGLNGLNGYGNRYGNNNDGCMGFYEGLAGVLIVNKWGFINKTGKFVINPQFSNITSFSEGLAAVCVGEYPNEKWGFIDTKGNVVIKPQFDDVGHTYYPRAEYGNDEEVREDYRFSNGQVFVVLNGKSGFINKQGKFVE